MRDHSLNSLGQIIAAAKESGSHFFDKDTLRFFSCRVSEMVYPTFGFYGTLFVTSEHDRGSSYGQHARYYTVRRAYWTEVTEWEDPILSIGTLLSIETVGEFQQYASRSGAHRAAKRMRLSHMIPTE